MRLSARKYLSGIERRLDVNDIYKKNKTVGKKCGVGRDDCTLN